MKKFLKGVGICIIGLFIADVFNHFGMDFKWFIDYITGLIVYNIFKGGLNVSPL